MRRWADEENRGVNYELNADNAGGNNADIPVFN